MGEDQDLENVVVHARGRVRARDHVYAHDKVAHLGRLIAGTVVAARVDLVAHDDPARPRPAFAKAELNVDGQHVRAHAAGETMAAAVDALQLRLRRRLERLDQRRSRHLRARNGDGAWHHGDAAGARPWYFPRSVEEREVVRRKTFAVRALMPDEAAWELEALDHDFYLFENAATHADNVIERLHDGGYQLIQPGDGADVDLGPDIRPSTLHPSTLSVDEAEQLLDLSDAPFVFFLDAGTARGEVLYRRYDGHYGLVVAATGRGEGA